MQIDINGKIYDVDIIKKNNKNKFYKVKKDSILSSGPSAFL